MGHFDLSLPDPMQEWIEDEVVGSDGYADASAYIAELVRRDQQRRGVPMTLEDLQRLVIDAKASGYSNRSVEEIFAAAKEEVRRSTRR